MSLSRSIISALKDGYRFAVVTIALAMSAPLLAAPPGHEVFGDWKFTAVLDGVEITSIDEKQAAQLVGKIMTIRADGTRFGDQRCGAPNLVRKRVAPNLYVQREARISAKKLRLPNPVNVVDIGCTQVFFRQPDQTVIFWDGFFFSAARVR